MKKIVILSALAILFVIAVSTSASAQTRRIHDRREDVRDRREDIRDRRRYTGPMDRVEDVFDRREDIRDRKEDRRDRRRGSF